ncbi:phosphotransferase [Sphingomonas sp. MMS24-J13]|uniref:phosphotransferase n=1 Tax=Sphingomonas sp. MMS24-J13 TaxID=3238686 RepID=UPI003850C70A
MGGVELRERVAALLGWMPDEWIACDRGYTPAARFIVRGSGEAAFVKAATTELTAGLINREIAVYRHLDGPFIPTLIAADADPDTPILIIEDLGAATWPPPWTDANVAAALAAIDTLHDSEASLGPYVGVHGALGFGWAAISDDPLPFLSTGIASADWLERALPALIEAEAACELDGTAPCHWDLRSDNLCITPSGARLIDWAEACQSNPQLDTGFWLPSLALEGGPPPEAILPDAPAIAAWVAGFFAARAGLPMIPNAPGVRRVQLDQLSMALPWAIRALGLAPI